MTNLDRTCSGSVLPIASSMACKISGPGWVNQASNSGVITRFKTRIENCSCRLHRPSRQRMK
ncbi:Uncharacterised protein [Vibrio cholerae]|nr:Uncharacterised protein [Vibrio cholerae]